jgi:hypothetical protein
VTFSLKDSMISNLTSGLILLLSLSVIYLPIILNTTVIRYDMVEEELIYYNIDNSTEFVVFEILDANRTYFNLINGSKFSGGQSWVARVHIGIRVVINTTECDTIKLRTVRYAGYIIFSITKVMT